MEVGGQHYTLATLPHKSNITSKHFLEEHLFPFDADKSE
jgi:hypothetical protein